MKKVLFLLLAIIILFSCMTPCFADRTYYLKYPGVSVSLPDWGYVVLTQDLSKYNSAWDQLGLSYDAINPFLKSNHIYLNAIATKGTFLEATHEIIITAVESEFSKQVQNLSLCSGKDLESLCSTVAKGLKDSGITVSDHTVIASEKSDNIKYFVFKISRKDPEQTVYGKMYSTVYNGKTINYTLWSYTDTGSLSSIVEFELDYIISHLEYDGNKAAATTAAPSATPATTSPSNTGSYLASKTAYKALVAGVTSLIIGVPALLIKSASKKKKDAQAEAPLNEQTIVSPPVAHEEKSVVLSESASVQPDFQPTIEETKPVPPKGKSFCILLDKLPPKLHRAFLFLEDEEWDRADQYFEAFLDEDPTNAYAYIGKSMVSLKIAFPSDISAHAEEIRETKTFQKALRYATPELKRNIDSTICDK